MPHRCKLGRRHRARISPVSQAPQARSQRRMPRRAASFLNQANRHPDSPGSTERSARTGAHSLDSVRRASTTTSSTARLPGAAGTIVMRSPVTARRAARRGCSNIASARSKISVTATRTAPGPRLNNNRVGSLSSSAELGVLLVTLKVTIDEILPKECTRTDFFESCLDLNVKPVRTDEFGRELGNRAAGPRHGVRSELLPPKLARMAQRGSVVGRRRREQKRAVCGRQWPLWPNAI